MEAYLNLFIVSLYVLSGLFVLVLLRLSGYILTVSLKKKKKRYFLTSFLLILVAPLVSLTLFRLPIGISTAVYFFGTILAGEAIYKVHQRYPVKTNWMHVSTILSAVAVLGFPVLFFWYANIEPPRVLQTEKALFELSTSLDLELDQTSSIISTVASKTDIMTLPVELKKAFSDQKPEFITIIGQNNSIIYSTKFSEMAGNGFLWFPWLKDASSTMQGVSVLPNGIPTAMVAYQLSSTYVGAKTVVVGYTLDQEYLTKLTPKLTTLAFGDERGFVWTSSSEVQERLLLDSADLNTQVVGRIPKTASSFSVEGPTGVYKVIQKPLTSLDSKSYYLTTLAGL